MPGKARPTSAAIDGVIRASLPRLRKPGVLTVRPGYEIAGHQLTGRSAIVATVHTKTKNLPKSDLLPDRIGNIPVDVREATPHQRLRAHDPAAAALTQAFARPEDEEPTWPLEREMPSGKLLSDPQSDTQKTLAQHRALQPATDHALKAREKKTQLDYQQNAPTKSFPLDPVDTRTTITAHVSPDAGFVTLKKFLAATQHSLVIGMYDFTSAPILQTFLTSLTGAKTLQMVLDHPGLNPTHDQTDAETVAKLREELGNRAQIAWALDNHDPMVTAWMFPYAYHIKVMVQDGKTFWLSSGNLNNSNQPDPASPPAYRRSRLARHHRRPGPRQDVCRLSRLRLSVGEAVPAARRERDRAGGRGRQRQACARNQSAAAAAQAGHARQNGAGARERPGADLR